MLEEIKNLSWEQTLGGVVVFLGLIAPGFLTLFLFKPELITNLETVKVLVFSLSLSMPIFFFNLFVVSKIEKEQKNPFAPAAGSLFLASVSFYSALLVTYLTSLNFKGFLLTIVIANTLILLTIFISKLNEKSTA